MKTYDKLLIVMLVGVIAFSVALSVAVQGDDRQDINEPPEASPPVPWVWTYYDFYRKYPDMATIDVSWRGGVVGGIIDRLDVEGRNGNYAWCERQEEQLERGSRAWHEGEISAAMGLWRVTRDLTGCTAYQRDVPGSPVCVVVWSYGSWWNHEEGELERGRELQGRTPTHFDVCSEESGQDPGYNNKQIVTENGWMEHE